MNTGLFEMQFITSASITPEIVSENVLTSQPTCSKSVMEPQNNVQNLFKVHERDTKTTSLNAQKRSEDVLNVFWTSYIRPVASFLSLGRFHTFWCFHFWFWTTQTHSITQYCGTAPTLWFTSIYLGTIFHF